MTANQSILQKLAINDPDWLSFKDELPESFRAVDAQIPLQLVDDIAALLNAERPDLAVLLDGSTQKPNKLQFGLDNETILTVTAAIFLLRSHIKFVRTPDGKFSFSFKHDGKRTQDDLVMKIKAFIEFLNMLFGGLR